MNLDKEKIDKLYYTIAKSQYGYSDSEDTYYKLVAAMERMKSSVSVINDIVLYGTWNTDAVAFVVWVNYVDLLIAAIESVSKSFDYIIRYDNTLYKYHGFPNKNDKDFFRFLRAIVLPHALSLDNSEQKMFTNGKTAYCPYVVWDSKGCVRIVYYNRDVDHDLNTYVIRIEDLQIFVEQIYNQIDGLCVAVEKKKKTIKGRAKGKLKNEKYEQCQSIQEKSVFLKQLTKKYGDLNDKSEKSFDICMLKRCEKICAMKFHGRNKELHDKYLLAVNLALDDYFHYLCEQRTDEKYLDDVLCPQYMYNKYTSFDGLGYPINKIVIEMEEFDSYFIKYDFPRLYNELKGEFSKRASFNRNMSVERLCFIVLMVQFFDKLEKNPDYRVLKEKLQNVL